MKKYREILQDTLGIRTLKTALATTLAVVIANLFSLHMPTMAGISAIVTMNNTVYNSYDVARNRMISTLVGVAMALLFWQLGWVNYWTLFLGILLIINICNRMKIRKATRLSLIVFLVIMLYDNRSGMPFYQYGFHRLFDTLVGLSVGLLVNRYVLAPSHRDHLMSIYTEAYTLLKQEMVDFLEGRLQGNSEALYQQLNAINTEMAQLYANRDQKLPLGEELNMKRANEINYLVYTAAAVLIEFKEAGRIAPVDLALKDQLEELLGQDLKIRAGETTGALCDDFNALLHEYLEAMQGLKIEFTEKGKTNGRNED